VSENAAGGRISARIAILDVLRGMALLGMILVHFSDRAGAGTGFGAAVQGTIEYLLSSKARAVFAMLFGAGFAIQLTLAARRGRAFTAPFLRRLAGLAVFGVAAEAAFGYDVLIGYAFWALPLLLLWRWPTKALLAAVVFCAMSYDLYDAGLGCYRWATMGANGANAAAEATKEHNEEIREARREAIVSESYSEVRAARIRHMRWFYTQPFSWTPWNELVFFLIGMLALRLGVWQKPLEHRRLIVGFMVGGALAWAAEHLLLPLPWPALPVEQVEQPVRVVFGLVRDSWLAFTLAGAVLLLTASSQRWMSRLSIFEAPGRMALTNYMLQAAVIDVVSSHYGAGLVFPPALVPVAAMVLFLAQVLFSQWWLRRFQFGPAEWVLRCITDGHRRPVRRSQIPGMPHFENV